MSGYSEITAREVTCTSVLVIGYTPRREKLDANKI